MHPAFRCPISACLITVFILGLAAQASAQVELLSQSRSVYAYVDDESPVSLSAPDFGLFEENLVLAWSCIGHYCGHLLNATQNSEIQTGHFSIHGHTSGSVWDEQGYYTSGGVRSDFEVLFEVTVPTPFSLIGSLASGGGLVFTLPLIAASTSTGMARLTCPSPLGPTRKKQWSTSRVFSSLAFIP